MKWRYLLYGVSAGLLLIVLQVFHYRAMIHDIELELFGVIVAILFMALGVFVGLRFVGKQKFHSVNKSKASKLKLSDRELEVLHLLSEGFSNQEIADKLFVSLNTTKTHLSNLYMKLNVSRRTQAVQKARELGVLSSP